MRLSPHLLVCISGHGYGHVAQVAPILNALAELIPDLRLTLRTTVPLAYLRKRITPEFHYLPEATDFGMIMHSALEVDAAASMQAYAEFHNDWTAKVAAESQVIASLAPDMVLSDVAYLPLAGAAALGIPSAAMCSLNWADVFSHYCGDQPGAAQILRQIEQAYLQATVFLRLKPAMPMPWLINQRSIGPVAQPGKNRRQELNARLGLTEQDKLVLVSMGGIATIMNIEQWPRLPNLSWLVPGSWLLDSKRTDMMALETLSMDFSDLLASTDLMLTKPGYGTFVEAACNGLPLLYVKRDEWPEQGCLIDWLQLNGLCRQLDAQQVQTGKFEQELQLLLNQSRPHPVNPTGKLEAANYLLSLLIQPAQSASHPHS
ncbi:MAG TPA: hypothetical protein VFF74_03325 [Methylophilaceae bacterium]|nr:hypothetical protein [Methylophilaceae bacterium]